VVRKKLTDLLAKFLPPDILKMRLLLLGPTSYSVIGDPSQKKFVQRRGSSQGGNCTTGDWKAYLDPLLHELDPEEKGEEATAFADDLALHPENQSALQEQLRVCERWAVNVAAKWEPTKSVVVVPPDHEVLGCIWRARN
jgi:Reverse transcriptase (RNA-dependent DNA polymerase)